MLDFLLPWVIALLSLLPATDGAMESLEAKLAELPGRASVVLVDLRDNFQLKEVEPVLDMPTPLSPDNLTTDTGKVPAYNSASGKVLGSVAEVAVEKSKVLESCTSDVCPPIEISGATPVPTPIVTPKIEPPIIIYPPYPGDPCPPWPPIETSLQVMPDRVMCMD